jgi:hypothetical protein
MQVISGKLQQAQSVLIYGPEGIGKSTLAAQFPKPIFIDCERGTGWMDVKRLPCKSWQDIMDAVKFIKTEKHEFKTVVIDSADWAEHDCIQYVCSQGGKSSLSDFDHGKGYVKLSDEIEKFLNSLNALIDSGMHVIFIAHCAIKKLELPDEGGEFDHYELNTSTRISPLLKQWAEAILFINYKVQVTENEKGRTKAIGGRKRIIHTQHTAAYDAKNRWGLPDQIPFELPFDFGVFAKVLGENVKKPVVEKVEPPPVVKGGVDEMLKTGQATRVGAPIIPTPENRTPGEDVPPKLATLMELSGVLVSELLTYCEGKSFIPKGGKLTEIKKVVQDQMVIETNWNKVVEKIKATRSK